MKPCLSALLLERLSRSSSTVWFPLFFLSPRAVCLDRCHLSVLLFQSVMRGTGWVLKAKCLAVTAASDARVPAAKPWISDSIAFSGGDGGGGGGGGRRLHVFDMWKSRRLVGRWRGSTVTCYRMKHEWPRCDSRLKLTTWGSCNRWILSFFSALFPHVALSCSEEWCVDSNKYYSLIPRICQDIISPRICPTFFATVEPNL